MVSGLSWPRLDEFHSPLLLLVSILPVLLLLPLLVLVLVRWRRRIAVSVAVHLGPSVELRQEPKYAITLGPTLQVINVRGITGMRGRWALHTDERG